MSTPDAPSPDHAVGPQPTDDAQETDVSDRGRPGGSPWLTAVALPLVAVLALLGAGLVGARLGGSENPRYPGESSVDAGFLRDMSTHHGQAVEMSMIARTASTSPDALTLAYDIATTQENQRGRMSGWLQQWGLSQAVSGRPMDWMMTTGHGHAGMADGQMLLPDGRMPGMASAADMQKLRRATGKDAEVLYLQLMIPHHRAGVEMARAAQTSATSPLVRRLAQTMVAGQQSEIDLMSTMLAERGAATPA